MSTITVQLPEDRIEQLKERATRLGVSLEDLIRVSVEELLSLPDEQFEQAADHVLKKNAELYKRLA
jgi:antitoxin FitA